MPTNFDLAPAPKTVDGLLATPIDIQRITATLEFDAAAGTGAGDATLEFTTGPQAGNPVFDLRQTITDAWLDGNPIPVASLAAHSFGAEAGADMRIVQSVLPANTNHTLRVRYTLGTPQASTAGSYQPRMTFSPGAGGPRLAFNFGFTDLGPGRYLEAWIPANLIFDQFELNLTIRVLNTPIAHSVITNGTVTPAGTNQWTIAFPARFTALSPLLEVRATDTLNSQTDTTTLPVSGRTITIEAWKLTSGAANLTTQINNIKTWFADNENDYGSYFHGNRFTAFLNIGGMEYEGGATSSTGALRHESFHSWFARGVKPASQADGWWDEAFTTYHDNGASGSTPFDFTQSPVLLCNRNLWSRTTAGGSYTDGNRFFEGVASLIGVATLKSIMGEFYRTFRNRPVTTQQLEEFLLVKSGNARIVDAFAKFIYGFDDPETTADLWIKDDPGHTGADLWNGRFWDSPDLWGRNQDDDGADHQNPEFGQDNFFYARVRNRGAATVRHFAVAFNVKPFAGTQFEYASDFLPCIAAATGFDLAPGAMKIVKARWPRAQVPPVGTHACWLASILTRMDNPTSGRHVWEHNNLAQKNLSIVDLKPNTIFRLPLVLRNFQGLVPQRLNLELVRPKKFETLETKLLHATGAIFAPGVQSLRPTDGRRADRIASDSGEPLDCCGHAPVASSTHDSASPPLTTAAKQSTPRLSNASSPTEPKSHSRRALSRRSRSSCASRSRLSLSSNLGPPLAPIDVIHRDPDTKKIVGGVAVKLRIK